MCTKTPQKYNVCCLQKGKVDRERSFIFQLLGGCNSEE